MPLFKMKKLKICSVIAAAVRGKNKTTRFIRVLF